MTRTALIAGILVMHPLIRAAQEESAPKPAACQVFGQVFDTDPPDGDMLVKAPSGSLPTGSVPERTAAIVRFTPFP